MPSADEGEQYGQGSEQMSERIFLSLPSDAGVQIRIASALSQRIVSNAMGLSKSRIHTLAARCERQQEEIGRLQARIVELERENLAMKADNASLGVKLEAYWHDEILPKVKGLSTHGGSSPAAALGNESAHSNTDISTSLLDPTDILAQIDEAIYDSTSRRRAAEGSAAALHSSDLRQKQHDANDLFNQIRTVLPVADFSAFLDLILHLPDQSKHASSSAKRAQQLLHHHPTLLDRFRRLILDQG